MLPELGAAGRRELLSRGITVVAVPAAALAASAGLPPGHASLALEVRFHSTVGGEKVVGRDRFPPPPPPSPPPLQWAALLCLGPAIVAEVGPVLEARMRAGLPPQLARLLPRLATLVRGALTRIPPQAWAAVVHASATPVATSPLRAPSNPLAAPSSSSSATTTAIVPLKPQQQQQSPPSPPSGAAAPPAPAAAWGDELVPVFPVFDAPFSAVRGGPGAHSEVGPVEFTEPPPRVLPAPPAIASAPRTGAAAAAAAATPHTAVDQAAYLAQQRKRVAVALLTEAVAKAAAASAAPAASVPTVKEAAPAAAAAASAHSSHDATYLLRVTANERLTPAAYDRNIFHLEMDLGDSGLRYAIGSALAVHGQNPDADVRAFLGLYGLEPSAVLSLPPAPGAAAAAPGGAKSKAGRRPKGAVAAADDGHQLQTALRAFKQDLDLFGRPGQEFYEALAPWARDPAEAAALARLGSEAGGEEFAARAARFATYAAVLLEFASARPPVQELLRLIPRIAPRHYSIASSQRMHPTSVHLCVVEVEWKGADGAPRFGQCSHYLAGLPVGAEVRVSVVGSEMHLPADPLAPVVMAGLGTGMAPFRAFIQVRPTAPEERALAAAPTPPSSLTLRHHYRRSASRSPARASPSGR